MREQRTTCDVCDVVKREVNHWWVVGLFDETCNGRNVTRLIISSYDETPTPTTRSAKDACGEKCVHVLVSRWMATGSLEEKVQEVKSQ